jgi:hypothetical protein
MLAIDVGSAFEDADELLHGAGDGRHRGGLLGVA